MPIVKDWQGNEYEENVATGIPKVLKERGQIDKDIHEKKVSHYIGLMEYVGKPVQYGYKYIIYNLVTMNDLQHLLDMRSKFKDVHININGTENPDVRVWLDTNLDRIN